MRDFEINMLFWTEDTDDSKSFVLFSKCSFEPYHEVLSNIGGMYVEKVESKVENDTREGWCFISSLRNDVQTFIEDAQADIEENESETLTLENVYDLLIEAFNRIGQLEKRNALVTSSKDLTELFKRVEVVEKTLAKIQRKS